MVSSNKISQHNVNSNIPHRPSIAHALQIFCIQSRQTMSAMLSIATTSQQPMHIKMHYTSLVPRPFLVGGVWKGRGKKGLVNNLTPKRLHGSSIIDSCEATNAYKFITHTSNVKPHVRITHPHEILFTTHTYFTFTFSLIDADGRNAAVDPCWGRVIHQTLPSSLSHPTHTGRVWEPN